MTKPVLVTNFGWSTAAKVKERNTIALAAAAVTLEDTAAKAKL